MNMFVILPKSFAPHRRAGLTGAENQLRDPGKLQLLMFSKPLLTTVRKSGKRAIVSSALVCIDSGS